MQSERLLVHWLDQELGHYGRIDSRVDPALLVDMLEETLLVALLVARDGVVIPASSLFENRRVPALIEHVAPFREAGLVRFVGADPSVDDFLEAKRESYGRQPDRHPAYFGPHGSRLARIVAPFWTVKRSSTTVGIASAWQGSAQSRDTAWLSILEPFGLHSKRIEMSLTRVPALLGPTAFIADFAADAVERETHVLVGDVPRARMNDLISRQYVRSYATDLEAAVLGGLPFLDTDRYIASDVERMSLTRLRTTLARSGFTSSLGALSPERFLAVRDHPAVRALLDDAGRRACGAGPLFDVAEAAALTRIARRRLSLRRATRRGERMLVDRAERYLEALAGISPPAIVNNHINTDFGSGNVFSGNVNVGGKQYTVQNSGDARAAIRAVLDRLVASDEGFALLDTLDGEVTAAKSLDSGDVEEAARDVLARAPQSRRREIAERLATGATSGLVVQGIIQALGAI